MYRSMEKKEVGLELNEIHLAKKELIKIQESCVIMKHRVKQCDKPFLSSYLVFINIFVTTKRNQVLSSVKERSLKALQSFSDGSFWEIIIIKQTHTFTSNILFGQRRFGLGCPSLYQVKWQEENENQPIHNYFSLLPELTGKSTW